MSARLRARARRREHDYTLDDLRPFLVKPEQERLKSLEHKLETPEALAEAIGEVLPQAAVVSQKRGEELSSAMQPLMLSSIHETVRKNPELFADAIFPSIGPAVRKAARAAVEALLQRLDDMVQQTMTLESLRWRIEAARTGRPFVEVVMLHNLAYRVEHVFLVHRESGLVLQHVAAENVAAEDPDQVSAMLAAIDDFARDAFHAEKEADLSRFCVGGLTGVVEHGPRAVLVAIVRGVATKDVAASLAETLEQIHRTYAAPLEQFKGDAAAFEPTRDALVGCMREERVQKPESRRRGTLALAAIAVLALVGAGIGWKVVHDRNARFDAYVEALGEEPGVTVTRTGRDGGRRFVEGLGDPLAKNPAALLAPHGLRASDVELRFKPIYSLDPPITERRAVQVLRPPSGVSLRLAGGTLVAAGVAERAWIDRARLLATSLPGVTALDDTRLFEAEALTSARAAAATLEGLQISFPPGSATPPRAEHARLDAAARAVQALLDAAPRGGLTARIEIVGHADATGTPEKNQRLSEERASSVAAELNERGVATDRLSVRGVGHADLAGRKVTFHVHLSPMNEGS
ncbi:OmpA family protein [Polyangium jinanense]|uniref:OmpA family protein n=1 Tax=Polyangium jinanense TaxID=2829994 RepID=A0A9X4AWY7_9BACT|nr:OmpA family protein [Polyangium jinanense]MDC3961432.1 OmpA family protein [Polyangium jinanense]MDC3987863.1 OmpA family protein [Polyangium jinanense]